VGTTKGTLSFSDCSKRYRMLPKLPCKLLTRRPLKICQGSGVGSIPIGRSILFKPLRRRFIFHFFQLHLCLPKISKCLRGQGLFFIHNSHRCSFFSLHSLQRSTTLSSIFRSRAALGSRTSPCATTAAASAVCEKTPEIDFRGPPVADLSVPPLARLALGHGRRQARNCRSLASLVLEVEGAARPTRTTAPFARGPRI